MEYHNILNVNITGLLDLNIMEVWTINFLYLLNIIGMHLHIFFGWLCDMLIGSVEDLSFINVRFFELWSNTTLCKPRWYNICLR